MPRSDAAARTRSGHRARSPDLSRHPVRILALLDGRFREAHGELRAHRSRSITLTAPRSAPILSSSNDGGELEIGARSFHRSDRIRRDVLAQAEAIITSPNGTLSQV